MLKVWRLNDQWSACVEFRHHHVWRTGGNPFSAALNAAISLLAWRLRGW